MTEKVPPHQTCPNGERCYLTRGTWMLIPKIFNPEPDEKVFWPGNNRRCSRDCISEQYDKAFGSGAQL